MGEIAELMLDGTLCEGCGVDMGDEYGYPRTCAGCRRENATLVRPPKVSCPKCLRRVKVLGLADHMRDVHKVLSRVMDSEGE